MRSPEHQPTAQPVEGAGDTGAPRGAWRPLLWAWVPASVWAVLCLQLWKDGVAARAVVLPVQPTNYYLLQALLVGPMLTFLGWVFAVAAVRWSRARPVSSVRLRHELLRAYSLPLAAHLVAELVGYHGWGSAGLSSVARYSAPLAFAVIGIWAARRLTAANAGWGRATVGAFGALVFQAVLGSWALR